MAPGGTIPSSGPALAATPKIAMLGWARLSMGAGEGGGLNQVVTQLAHALVERGHRVVYLRSGLDYSMSAGVRIVPEEPWRGVECFDLVNSPNLSVGHCNFENVREQIASPGQSRLIAAFLKEQHVGVLHLHVFEGVAFDLVDIVNREAGIPVVVTPHNYAAVCPQIDLLHQERSVCDDYDGGRRCATCLRVPDFRWEMRRRARVHTARRILGPVIYDAIKPFAASVIRGALALLPRPKARHAFESPTPRGTGFAEAAPPGAPPAHVRLLANKDRHLVVLNEYGERRRAGIAALNGARAVLAPGRYLMAVHEAMGVSPQRLRHVPLGLAHIDALRLAARASADFDAPGWTRSHARPLRVVFFGNCWVNKGLAILIEAIAMLPEASAARVELNVFASGDDRALRQWMVRADRSVTFHGAFGPADQAGALERADVGVFPGIALENSPLVILEMLAAGRLVVASRRGAAEEFVIPERTGVLFDPGSPAALSRAIIDIVEGRTRVPSRREVQEASPSRTLAEYVEEMVGVYREVSG